MSFKTIKTVWFVVLCAQNVQQNNKDNFYPKMGGLRGCSLFQSIVESMVAIKKTESVQEDQI